MTLRAYTLDDLAAELGRTPDWASRHWRGLVKAGKLPPPVVDVGSPTWDAAQVYAYRDKHLPAAMRAVAAAFRAALDAASRAPAAALHSDYEDESRARLERFVSKQKQEA